MTSAALENIGRTAAAPENSKRDRRGERLRAQAMLRSLTDHKGLKNCGLSRVSDVTVQGTFTNETSSCGVAGLQTCSSVWACPYCASKIAKGRTDYMERAIEAHSKNGGSFVLTTLTLRHNRGQSLKTVWDGVSKSWRSFVSSRAYKDLKLGLGIEGSHRTTEVMYGEFGWHVHLHVLYFVQASPAALLLQSTGERMLEQWVHSVANHGFSAVTDAQDWKVLRGSGEALKSIASYVHKGEYKERTQNVLTGRNIAMEMTRADLKESKVSRHPFTVLADVLESVEETGEIPERDWAIWSEWEETSRGRRQQMWSRGLKEKLGLDEEMTDTELAELAIDGVDLVKIPAAQWNRFARDGRRHSELLKAVEGAIGGFFPARMAAASVLKKYGVEFVLCAPPDIS